MLESTGKAKSVTIQNTNAKAILPPSEKIFVEKFQEYIDSLKGEDEQSKKKTKTVVKDKGAFPACYTPKIGPYEVEDCPWKLEALDAYHGLYNSALYKESFNPYFSMKVVQLL